MPYKIEKSGNEWIVRNKETGESKGRSKTREKAVEHLRKLYLVEGLKKS